MALEARQAGSQVPDRHHQPTSDAPSPTSHSVPWIAGQAAAAQDTNLLRSITSHIAQSRLSTLIVPLAFIELSEDAPHANGRQMSSEDRPLVPREMLECMDDGAADVFFGPLALDRIRSIASHAYRVRKDKSKQTASFQEAKKARKRSWVGIDDRKPYSYLREEMYVRVAVRYLLARGVGVLMNRNRVSGLMTGICSPEDIQPRADHRYFPCSADPVFL